MTFNSLPKANLQHPYLLAKKIKQIPDDIHQLKDSLVVPIYNIYGEIISIQFIEQNGQKRYLSGARKQGGFYIIGNEIKDGDHLIICKGGATGLSLWSILKEPVIVAFDAGNLKSVEIDLRRKHPNSKIIIAADNDCNSNYNTGIEKAKEAAEEVGNAIVLYPVQMDEEKNFIKMNVDWNDIYCEYGDEVKMIKSKIDMALQSMELLKQVKFHTHEAKLAKQNNIYRKGE